MTGNSQYKRIWTEVKFTQIRKQVLGKNTNKYDMQMSNVNEF